MSSRPFSAPRRPRAALVPVAIGALAAALFGFAAPRASAQSFPPWHEQVPEAAVESYFLVQAPETLVLGDGTTLGGKSGPLAALNERFGVTSIARVHRTPPRGWRNPQVAAELGLDRMWIFALGAPVADLDAVVRAYAAVAGVERAWRDHVVQGAGTPNDTLFPSQWNLQTNRVDCVSMWDYVTTESVLIGVVDSGVDLDHPDLKDNVWSNPAEIPKNKIDDDGNGYVDDVQGYDFWNGDSDPDDDCGHGSHVAGILGAKGNDARDVAGICWSASILPVKVLSATGAGTWTSLAQGVVYAADQGISIANYSFGGHGGDPGLAAAVTYAASLDIVQVGAAGNYGDQTAYYPAAYPEVMAVMASDPNDKIPLWSTYGSWCDLCAPGDAIYSLWKGGLTNVMSGTSMAAPHVAGVAAIVRSQNAQLDRLDTELVLEMNTDDLGAAGRDSTYQWGRLDANQAFAAAQLLTVSRRTASPGETVDVYVADAAHPGDYYVVQPTFSGRLPGYPLSVYFGADARWMPINPDWVTTFALSAQSGVVFSHFIASLDGSGLATATVNLPPGQGLEGLTMTFGGFTVDPSNLAVARHVLNTVSLTIQ